MTTAIYTRFSPRPIKRKGGVALTEDAEAAEIERETGGADAAMRETLTAMQPVESSPGAQ